MIIADKPMKPEKAKALMLEAIDTLRESVARGEYEPISISRHDDRDEQMRPTGVIQITFEVRET